MKNIQKFQDAQDNIYRLEKILKGALMQKQFNMINASDFHFLMQNAKTEHLIALFPRQFYQANPNLIQNVEIAKAMTRFDKGQARNVQLNLIQYHKHFLEEGRGAQSHTFGAEVAQNFLQQNVKSTRFNYLGFSFHLHKLVNKNIFQGIDPLDLLWHFQQLQLLDCRKVSIYKKFGQLHSQLLSDQLQISSNPHLASLLLEAFYGAKTEAQGYMQYLSLLSLLNRLHCNESAVELLVFLKQVFQQSFVHFFKNLIPKVLNGPLLRNFEQDWQTFR